MNEITNTQILVGLQPAKPLYAEVDTVIDSLGLAFWNDANKDELLIEQNGQFIGSVDDKFCAEIQRLSKDRGCRVPLDMVRGFALCRAAPINSGLANLHAILARPTDPRVAALALPVFPLMAAALGLDASSDGIDQSAAFVTALFGAMVIRTAWPGTRLDTTFVVGSSTGYQGPFADALSDMEAPGRVGHVVANQARPYAAQRIAGPDAAPPFRVRRTHAGTISDDDQYLIPELNRFRGYSLVIVAACLQETHDLLRFQEEARQNSDWFPSDIDCCCDEVRRTFPVVAVCDHELPKWKLKTPIPMATATVTGEPNLDWVDLLAPEAWRQAALTGVPLPTAEGSSVCKMTARGGVFNPRWLEEMDDQNSKKNPDKSRGLRNERLEPGRFQTKP